MEKVHISLKDGTKMEINGLLEKADCRTQTEFVQKAIEYYSAMVMSETYETVLTKDMQSCINASLAFTEANLRRLLYKQAIQVGMINHLLIMSSELPPEQVTKLRGKVIRELNESVGNIDMEKIAKDFDDFAKITAGADLDE